MKQLVLLFVLVVLVSAPALADDPQFKLEVTGSDHAGFSVLYSWPGEGKPPIECTVTVRVTYSRLGKFKDGKSEDFTFKNKLHNTGSGWAYFDGKAALDTTPPDMKIDSRSCN